MRVEFWRNDEARIAGWDVVLPKRNPVRSNGMALGSGLSSHDLEQYVIEAATGYEFGFWGLVARGATFRSMAKTVTKPGRAVIVAHRAELDDSERLAGLHGAQWRAGVKTPVTEALSVAAQQFQQLGRGDRLVFEWPSATGVIRARAASGAVRRPR